jgi:hypothetical protein
MFNKTDVHITINNNYTVEDGGILVVNTAEESTDKIVNALQREDTKQPAND